MATDYSADIRLVRAAVTAHLVRGLLSGPAALAAGAMDSGLLRGVLSAVGGTNDGALAVRALDLVWRAKYGADSFRYETPVVRAMWDASTQNIGSIHCYGSTYEYRVVFGIPVGAQPNHRRGWCQSPATSKQILERGRGHDWLFGRGEAGAVTLTLDSAVATDAVMDARTQALIDDIESVPGCRARVLWGPPRAGKSVAAKQIARAVGGSWARVCGDVCTEASVWRALDVLRPNALIIDDIDISAGSESPLMLGLEQARAWARVIISTANVVPSAGNSDGCIRGAVIGRASDGALVEYRELSEEVRRALAPDVTRELDTADLLAQHQVELQRRAVARGVSQADVDELRALQALIGDR